MQDYAWQRFIARHEKEGQQAEFYLCHHLSVSHSLKALSDCPYEWVSTGRILFSYAGSRIMQQTNVSCWMEQKRIFVGWIWTVKILCGGKEGNCKNSFNVIPCCTVCVIDGKKRMLEVLKKSYNLLFLMCIQFWYWTELKRLLSG